MNITTGVGPPVDPDAVVRFVRMVEPLAMDVYSPISDSSSGSDVMGSDRRRSSLGAIMMSLGI